MRSFILFFIFTYTMYSNIYSQNNYYLKPTNSNACGGITTNILNSGSFSFNPADLNSSGFLISTTIRNNYLIKDLNSYQLDFLIPMKSSGISIGYLNRGFASFQDHSISVGTGLRISNRMNTGIRISINHISFQEVYNPEINFKYIIGTTYKINPNTTLGIIIDSPYLPNDNNEQLGLIALGLKYQLLNQLMLYTELEGSISNGSDARIGLEYVLNKTFTFYTGTSFFPGVFSFGCQIRYSDFIISIASSRTPYLGFSTQISLLYMKAK